ncbi:hypothetical protein [Teredinibacter franksiae]|uniref:hypothetical protein n=1 Tax=Teredinibacter franksiae TaxID=2761453 RepID=UPI0016256AF3|nr:hypothetical protein [Teredinibacter franksiae]
MIKFFKEQPGMAVTALYIYMSIVGLIYQFFHLRRLGINVLDYASPSDFIMAFGKATPYILFMVVVHLLVLFKDLAFNQRHMDGETFWVRCKNTFFTTRSFEVISIIFVIPFAAMLIGNSKGTHIEAHVEIEIPGKIASEVSIPERLYLIETTGKYIFVSDGKRHYVVMRDKLSSYQVYSTNKSSKKDAASGASS